MPGRSDYRIELTACFTFTIDETVRGRQGLARAELEQLIEDNWWWISGSTDVLLESSWKLDSFEELPAHSD